MITGESLVSLRSTLTTTGLKTILNDLLENVFSQMLVFPLVSGTLRQYFPNMLLSKKIQSIESDRLSVVSA